MSRKLIKNLLTRCLMVAMFASFIMPFNVAFAAIGSWNAETTFSVEHYASGLIGADFDSSDNPAVMYLAPGWYMGYSKYNGSSWDSVETVDYIGSTASNGELKFNPVSGTASATYYLSDGSLRFATRDGGGSGSGCGGASADADWNCETIDTGLIVTIVSGFEFDSSGKAHVAYIKPGPVAYYATNASGSWVTEEVVDLSISGSNGIDLTIDGSDDVYISYITSGATTFSWAERVGGGGGSGCTDSDWTCNSGNGETSISRPEIAIDSSGNPHISYYKSSNVYHATYSGSWTTTSVDTGTSSYTDIEIYGNKPYMTYALSTGEIYVAVDDGAGDGCSSGWSCEEASAGSGSLTPGRINMAISDSGELGVAITNAHSSNEIVRFVYGSLSSTNTAPTATAPGSISQSVNGDGYITFSTTVADTDSDDTRLKVEYSEDGGSSWFDPDLVSATPSSGTVDLNDANEYQIGTSDAIDTSGGSKTITIVWDTQSVSNGNGSLDDEQQSDIQVRVTPYDGSDVGSASASSNFTVDNLDPTGITTLVAGTPTTSTMPLSWTAPSDANFSHTEIWYGSNQSDVQNRTGTATEWDDGDDANLASAATTGTTITGLSPGVDYYFKAWAMDDAGNEITAADISKATLANAPGTPTVAASATTALDFVIDQNSNSSSVEYAIRVGGSQYVQADGTLAGSEIWQTYSAWGGLSGDSITGLSANTQYSVDVKARNSDATETAFSSASAKYTYASPVTGVTLANTSTSDAYSLQATWTDASQPGMKIDYSSLAGGSCDSTYDVGDYDNDSVNATSPKSLSTSGGTAYRARILSYNSDGVLNTVDEALSNCLVMPPAQVTGLTTSGVSPTSITWDWNDVTGATNYKVYRDSDDALVGETASSTSSFTQTSVVDGGAALSGNVQYTVYVRAEDSNGEGISSTSASAYSGSNLPVSLSHDAGGQTTTGMLWTWASGGSQKDYFASMTTPSQDSGYITGTSWSAGSMSTNTEYTFFVKSRNEDDVLSNASSASACTAQGNVTGATWDTVTSSAITLTATGSFTNLSEGSSGIRFVNTVTAADNTFSTATWANTSLSPNLQYTYNIYGVNCDGDSTATYYTDSKYTLAAVPGITTDTPTSSSLEVTIDANGNSASTEYVIHEVNTDQYVQSDGTLGASPVWQAAAISTSNQWGFYSGESGVVTVSGLTPATEYDFEVKARNGEAVETAYGTSSSLYALPYNGNPTINSPTLSSVDVNIDVGSNPSSTTYSIQESSTTNYVQADGSLAATEVFQTAADWGSVSGTDGKITVTGLSPGVAYSFQVTAKSAGGAETESAWVTLYTLTNPPNGLSGSSPVGTQITVAWSANSNSELTEYQALNVTNSQSSAWTTDLFWGNTGLTCSTGYTFKIKSRNGDEVESAYSDEISISTASCSASGGSSSGGGSVSLLSSISSPSSSSDSSDSESSSDDSSSDSEDSDSEDNSDDSDSSENSDSDTVAEEERIAEEEAILEAATSVITEVIKPKTPEVATREPVDTPPKTPQPPASTKEATAADTKVLADAISTVTETVIEDKTQRELVADVQDTPEKVLSEDAQAVNDALKEVTDALKEIDISDLSEGDSSDEENSKAAQDVAEKIAKAEKAVGDQLKSLNQVVSSSGGGGIILESRGEKIEITEDTEIKLVLTLDEDDVALDKGIEEAITVAGGKKIVEVTPSTTIEGTSVLYAIKKDLPLKAFVENIDNDPFSLSAELYLGLDPLVENTVEEASEVRVTNISPDIEVGPNPGFRVSGEPGSTVEVILAPADDLGVIFWMDFLYEDHGGMNLVYDYLLDENLAIVAGSTEIDEQYKGIIQSEKTLKDGSYFILTKQDDDIDGMHLSKMTVNADLKDFTPKIAKIDSEKGLVRGTAEPGQTVMVTWESTIFSSVVIADASQGEFEVSIPDELEEGEHEVIVYVLNEEEGWLSDLTSLLFGI